MLEDEFRKNGEAGGVSSFDQKFKELKEEQVDFGDENELMPEYQLFEGEKGILFAENEKKLIEHADCQLVPEMIAHMIDGTPFEGERYDIKAASGLLLSETEKKQFVFE